MGRPPCCDKMGVKKGPWTPEEDILLVSYVQQHGPGNWRAVPSNTGLRRCSKSCRLRWTNYLRPGIRRGDFTADEEQMIIQLQDLLGNKWAAIASYMPDRTDNDIKNYWNTHLKKKLQKLENKTSDINGGACLSGQENGLISPYSHSISRGQWERRLQTDIHMAKQALNDALSSDQKPLMIIAPPKPSTSSQQLYASNTENIAKLLKGWMKSSPQTVSCSSSTTTPQQQYSLVNNIQDLGHVISADYSTSSEGSDRTKSNDNGIDLSEALKTLFGFESLDSSSNITDFSHNNHMSPEEASTLFQVESKPDTSSLVPFSMFENWLFDEISHAKVDHY